MGSLDQLQSAQPLLQLADLKQFGAGAEDLGEDRIIIDRIRFGFSDLIERR